MEILLLMPLLVLVFAVAVVTIGAATGGANGLCGCTPRYPQKGCIQHDPEFKSKW